MLSDIPKCHPFLGKSVVSSMSMYFDSHFSNYNFTSFTTYFQIFKVLQFYNFLYIINESYFCVRHKNRSKHGQYFKLLFFTTNLHFATLNQCLFVLLVYKWQQQKYFSPVCVLLVELALLTLFYFT